MRATAARRESSLFRPCAPPDGAYMPWRRLLRVPSSGSATVVVLSDSFVFFPLHFNAEAKALVPCYGDSSVCGGCNHKWPIQQYAYASVMNLNGRSLNLLAVPPAAWINCPSRPLLLVGARGRILKLSRLVESKRGPIRLQVGTFHPDGLALPAAWDVIADVYRRFGYDERASGDESQGLGEMEEVRDI